MTNAPFSPFDSSDAAADPATDGAKTPAHRARKIAAAVSAGAFAGIAIGLVATHAGADDNPDVAPTSADGGQQQSPFGQFGGGSSDQFGGQDLDGDGRTGDPGDFFGQGGTSDQYGGQDLDGDGRTGDPGDVFGDGGSSDQFGGSTGQFAPPSSGGATPAPFGGQTAPDTNSGGS